MFKEVSLKEGFSKRELNIIDYWRKNGIEQKSIEEKDPNNQFVFYEGPPTANGKPGIHHVMARAIKDFVCRYHTMKGFQVKRKAGWDTHGLPVEIAVEKELGLDGKPEIEAYGIEAFNKKCKESVFKYEKLWREITERIGYWLDMDNPYITLDNNYVESIWWLIKQFFEKDLIYLGYKILPYCPRCGTPLSSHEVAQGYRTTKDPSIYIKVKVKNEDNLYFLVWTTTPWTLLSNVALAFNPENKYVTIKHKNEKYVLAKSRLNDLFKPEEYDLLEEKIGKEYEGIEYEPLFPYAQFEEKAYYTVTADYVTLEDGTGIVHIAPAFGEDDYQVGKKHNLPVVQMVNDEGLIKDEVEPWKGMFFKDADPDIMRDLKDRGILIKKTKIEHTYPFCWRCDSPLIYYARDSWYIKTTEFKDKLLENNKKINWYPKFVGEGRFGQWLENNIDWAISRNRYWGTPLNIWLCSSCGHKESLGSREELMDKDPNVTKDIDLHRPYVDDITYDCPKCSSGKMKRTPEVLDCWFDSGGMPFAQQHYPFENKEEFDKSFPADFICEGIDQTRGWFYSLLAISTLITGKSSYKTCVVNELILDEKGNKMSKSRGNAVNPWEVIEKFGADAVRWYLFSVSPPWAPTKFDTKGVQEITNKFLGTLFSTYSFFAIYANIDKYKPELIKDPTNYPQIDTWILSKLHNLIKTVREWNDIYELSKATRAVNHFILEDLSNWYIRRSRRRFWAFDLTEDKKSAYNTLYTVLIEVSKLIAPYAPFASEEIYLNLGGSKESVHLDDYPVYDEKFIQEKIEGEMDLVRNLVYLGRAARNKVQIKVRQPLGNMYIPVLYKETVESMESLIKEEINVKEISYIDFKDYIVNYELKLEASNLGPKYGKLFPKIMEAVGEIDPLKIVIKLRNEKEYHLTVHQQEVKLTPEDVEIRFTEKENFIIEKDESNQDDKANYIALNTLLTPELIEEGFARELVNKIQFQRKENNFEIMDKIKIHFNADDEIKSVFGKYREYILGETLADSYEFAEKTDDSYKEWNVNGKKVLLKLEVK